MCSEEPSSRIARVARAATALIAVVVALGGAAAQTRSPGSRPTNYVVGAQDVLTITSYDQENLTGEFSVEADGTFTYPMIGRFKAGGLTLRDVEAGLKKRLVDEGYFKNPQITVAIKAYKSQKIIISGEVRTPGTYTLSGDMNLLEALAAAGSTLPTASGEVLIAHADHSASGPPPPNAKADSGIVRVDLKALQNGVFSQNASLRDGDTIFVTRAETIYVYGEVKNPNAYALPQRNTTVMQALSLAGGMTNRGRESGIKIIRIVGGKEKELSVTMTDLVQPGDVVKVPERWF